MKGPKTLLVASALLAILALGTLIAYTAFALGRISTVPGSTDFWKSFGAPIASFAAALATIFVGLVALFGAVYASFRQEKSNEATRIQTAADNEATRNHTAAENEATRNQTAADNEATRKLTQTDNAAARRQTAELNEATLRQTSRENQSTRQQTALDIRDTRRQTAADNEALRKQTARDEELARCWDRFTWLVDRFGGTTRLGEKSAPTDPSWAAAPAELFPADIVVEIAISLEADADRLEDESLTKALRLYHQTLANQF